MSDHARENCTRCNELEAEVAQLRQKLDAAKADAIHGWSEVEHQTAHKTEYISMLHELEAARDHLRARLQLQVSDWQATANEHREAAEAYPDAAIEGWIQLGHAEGFDKCVADLLAVLTEQHEEKKDDPTQSRVGRTPS